MTITFHHPPTRTVNPLIDFEACIAANYPKEGEAGLYIYGIRAKVDGRLKFIPIVVGESEDLRERLFEDHYQGKFVKAFENLIYCRNSSISEKKEIWNFSKWRYDPPELLSIYDDMDFYDRLPPRGRAAPLFLNAIAALQHLLYFQNNDFYNYRFRLTEPIRDIRSDEAVRLLMEKSGALFLATVRMKMQLNASNLLLALKNFTENFYFVYASNEDEYNSEVKFVLSDERMRKSAEYFIKQKLKSINIHTTADAKNIEEGNNDITLDLSKIQNELVNIGEHDYNDANGNYKKPLIL